MSEIAVLVGAMLSPLLALGLLLWLTHLEETLAPAVHAAQRKPPPPPILAVEVRPSAATTAAATAATAAAVPEPRPKPVPAPAPTLGQAFSRSDTLSLGGSTNR